MDIMEAILARRSVRAYDGAPLSKEHATLIREFIATTRAPGGVSARVELIHADLGSEPTKLGTYGSVKGATDFLGLIYTPGAPLAEEFAAYYFEQLILYCTSLGLGTVWVAGFTHGSFTRHIKLQPGEKLTIASPVGYPGGTKPLMARIGLVNFEKMHVTKKPFEVLFFAPGFVPLTPEAGESLGLQTGHAHRLEFVPLTPEQAGEFQTPLEMARLGPSARNQQNFRALVDGACVHFYVVPAIACHLDAGIAMCHFEQTCLQLGMGGAFDVLTDAPTTSGLEYVATWTRDN